MFGKIAVEKTENQKKWGYIPATPLNIQVVD